MVSSVSASEYFTQRQVATLIAPWSMAFLPDGTMLVTERPPSGAVVNPTDPGHIRIVTQAGVVSAPITGVPANVGVLDIILDPDFSHNHVVYFSLIERDPAAPRVGRGADDLRIDPAGIAVVRAVLDTSDPAAPALTATSILWEQTPKIVSAPGSGEPGGRLTFSPDGAYLFIAAGDRQEFTPVQSLDNTLGKIVRIHPDGTIPSDNPYVGIAGALPEIWSLGHRNPYGLVFDADGTLWENEMGPKGGDELNVIAAGANYGWPRVSYGDAYDGTRYTKPSAEDGYAAAAAWWTPVIAPAGMIAYSGDDFPSWAGDLILPGLQSQGLVIVDTDGAQASEIARISLGARTRDVAQGPDGSLWVLFDAPDGRLVQLLPLAGAVIRTGTTGDDTFTVTKANDIVVERPNEGIDTVITWVSYAMPANVERMVLAAGSSAELIGNAHNGQTLTGNELGTIFYAGAGNTTIIAGGGVDTLIGGTGDDLLSGGAGADRMTGGGGIDTFRDTAANLDGDTITDFVRGDRIVVTDGTLANFFVTRLDSALIFSGGSLTFGTLPVGRFVASAAAGGGVELSITKPPVENDFNGDGRSDILWRNANTGQTGDWLAGANGVFTANGALIAAGSEWSIVGTGDFNGDGRSDILWRNSNGQVTDWFGGTDGNFAPSLALAGATTAWNVSGTGDFNGDGRSDILWRNSVTGQTGNWLADADGRFSTNSTIYGAAADWTIAGTGDFNGDGRFDILWRNDNGQVGDWFGRGDGTFAPNGTLSGAPTEWRIVGTGDFNGDGRSDILWRNANTGQIGDWLADGNGSFAGNPTLYGVTADWKVIETGDYNGDGRADILWRNDDGRVGDWFANADGTFTVNPTLYGAAHEWRVQPETSFLI